MRKVVVKLIPWDASEIFPDGTHAISETNPSPAAQKFLDDMYDALGRDATPLGVLPLVEPGRALVMMVYEDSE